jgi:nitrogen regulatory protein PII
MEVARARLVTIVVQSFLVERLCRDLKLLGVSGYTKTSADGVGSHGERRRGFFDAANARVETIVSSSKSSEIFEHMLAHYDSNAYIAFAHDVDAIPGRHFEPSPRDDI